MQKFLCMLMFLFFIAAIFSPSSYAVIADGVSFHIDDNYRGSSQGVYGGFLRHDKDVISGQQSGENFNIDWMDIEIIDTWMCVDIHTDYYKNISGLGTDFGDLFISIDGWTPYGDDPYYEDTSFNGTDWEYVFDVSGGNLYNIQDAQDHILLSDNVMGPKFPTHPDWYRHNQEVLINPAGLNPVGEGSAFKYGEYYYLSFDIAALNLDIDNLNLGFHWTQTCGNDVIEGGVKTSTPEPATMLLLGFGIIGAAVLRKKI